MESKTKNRKSPEQIALMVERAFGKTPLAVSELKEGWFNAAYNVELPDGRAVILKIAPPVDAEVMTYEKNLMTTEVVSMRLVAQNPAIPVPQIYSFDTQRDLCDSDYFFMEKLTGSPFNHVKPILPIEEQAQLDQKVGALIGEINTYTGTYFGYEGNSDLRGQTWREAFAKIIDAVLEDGVRKNADYVAFTFDEIRAAVQKHLPALNTIATPQLVHWDAWEPNIFVQDGSITGIIDFERALWGDPLMEAQFRPLASGGVSEGLKGYGKTTFTPEETVRCHLYTLYLALVMKTECYYRDFETDEVSDIAMRYLIPTMRWLQAN